MQLQPNIANTKFSPSGKVAYATTNYVAFLEKESVHADFHSLMDFLKNSPLSYALTASPPIYAEIVQEMWSTADCSSSRGGIKCTIKGNSYIITPSVINEALHLPLSNFENLPTDSQIISMLKAINYAGNPWSLGQIFKNKFRKEWSYFFDTLNKVFAGRCSYATINNFVLKIGYSLLYGRRIHIGELLLDEFSYKLGAVRERDHIIYYPRFLMVIASHLCKELTIEDRSDTLQVPMHTKKLFARLVTKNLNAEVEFVLPEHVRGQLSTLYSSPSHTSSLLLPPPMEDVREGYTSPSLLALPSPNQSVTEGTSSVSLLALPSPYQSVTVGTSSVSLLALPSPYQSVTAGTSSVSQSAGKRKNSTLPSIIEDGNEGNETTPELYLPQKKREAGKVSSLSVIDLKMPPAETRDGLRADELSSSPVEENQILDLLEPAPGPENRQHLVNAASVLKSQLVDRLTSYGDILSTDDMILLANKCYETLEGLGDNYTSFSAEVNKLIAQHQERALVAKKKEDWNEWDMKAGHIHKLHSLFKARQNLSSAQDKLSTAKTQSDSLNLKREEMTGELLKLTEECHEAEERVKIFTAERDQYDEAHSLAEAEVGNLDAEKEEARAAVKAISDQYNAANREYENIRNHLLQLVRK